jgi:predicted aminopeptidase
MNALLPALSSFLYTGCYTLTQGIEQARLISRRVPLDSVLAEGREKPERIEKLRLVGPVLKYAEERAGMTAGSSYKTYISLDRPSLSYVVQAAEKRKLKLKTWWFPVVGSQPYLGFFDKQKALDFQKELVAEGFDTTVGGVQAFSLLGFFPDPVYSSMVDGNDAVSFVELLFHETVHRTLYVPDAYTFNENLAEFAARRATLMFVKDNRQLFGSDFSAENWQAGHERMQKARQAFGEMLNIARNELTAFYAQPEIEALQAEAFLKARKEKFAALDVRFQSEFGNRLGETYYARFFKSEKFNNATLLSASVYQSRQEPFQHLLDKTGGDLAKFLQAVKKCVSGVKGSESGIWTAVETCGG